MDPEGSQSPNESTSAHPILEPGYTLGTVTDKISPIVLGRGTSKGWIFGFSDRLPAVDAAEFRRWLPADQGRGNLGHQYSDRLGIRDRQFRVVDRNRARRNADFRHPSFAAPEMAHVDQPVRGSDDAVCGGLRGHVPAAASWAGRGWRIGCSRIRIRWERGRNSAARWCGTCLRYRRTRRSRCCSGSWD